MNEITGGIITVATALVGVAILAVLVSRNAQTPQVIGSAASGFAQDIAAAVSPVTGASGGFGLGGFTGGGAPYLQPYN